MVNSGTQTKVNVAKNVTWIVYTLITVVASTFLFAYDISIRLSKLEDIVNVTMSKTIRDVENSVHELDLRLYKMEKLYGPTTHAKR